MSTALAQEKNLAPRSALAKKLRRVFRPPVRRVLIIHPPQIAEQDFLVERALNRRYWSYPPYGEGVLSRSLRDRGYVTDLLDLNYDLLALSRKERQDFSYPVWKTLLHQKVDDFQPDAVAVSCMFTMTHSIMADICRAIKKINPSTPVMAGGVHVTNARKLVLEDCTSIDFIGLYECEVSLPDMLDFVNGKASAERLAQIASLVDGRYVALEIRTPPSADEIRFKPYYHQLPVSDYDSVGQVGTYGFERQGRKAASSLSEKGCRAHCSFCSVASFNGAGVRKRTVIDVVDEIEELSREHGIKHITWLDDDLLYDKDRAMGLFNEIYRRKMDITWDASNGLIAAAITQDLMDAMVASGCIGFNLGIESGNPEILRAVHKPGSVDSFRKAKILIDKYPQVFVKGFLMMGFPNETLRMMLDTVNLALELNFDWYPIQILNPLPSTEIYGLMIEQGLIQDGLETSNVAFVFGPHGKQRLREQREKLNASDFFNLFNACDPDSIPKRSDLGDYWFLMDYKLNYEKILGIQDPVKLRKISMMLTDVCDRVAPDNPMAHLFQGIIDKKVGHREAAAQRLRQTRILLADSAYWKKRFDALALHALLEAF